VIGAVGGPGRDLLVAGRGQMFAFGAGGPDRILGSQSPDLIEAFNDIPIKNSIRQTLAD
jgi:hypothetical protein